MVGRAAAALAWAEMSQDPLGDIPLFRELQRLLSVGDGPINMEIARQVAIASNQDSSDTLDPGRAQGLADAAREVEFLVAGYTRRTSEEPLRVDALSRRSWVAATLIAYKWFLDRLAARFALGMESLAGPPGEGGAMEGLMGQVMPLLLGMQAGTLVGQLARESIGRYDPPIPRDDDGRLHFITSNVDEVATEYEIDLASLQRWLVSIDAVKHDLEAGTAWVARYRRAQFAELVDSIEIDATDLERRLVELQSQGPQALQEGLGAAQLLPVVQSERHRRAVDSVRAFSAIFDGYARHVTEQIWPQTAGDLSRLQEGIRRRALASSSGRSMLEAMLGLSKDVSLEQAGLTFCNGVAELRGVLSLNRLWDAPDNLPTVAEVADPFGWIERVLDS